MKRVRKWLFALLTGVMVLGGSVACFAKTTTFTSQYDEKRYQIIIDDSALEQYPYWYLVYDYDAPNTRYDLYMTKNPMYNSTESGGDRMVCLKDTDFQILRKYYVNGSLPENNVLDFSGIKASASNTWKSSNMGNGGYCFSLFESNINHPSYDFHSFMYSSAEIMKVDYGGESGKWTVNGSFFYPPLAEVALELPKMVENQTEMILPIAVCCLALLIGFLTLLPKLRKFLYL